MYFVIFSASVLGRLWMKGTAISVVLFYLLLKYVVVVVVVIMFIEFLTSQLCLGNIHLSWDVIINRIRLGGLICSLKSFLQLNMCQELQISAFVYMCIGVQVKFFLDFVIVTLELLHR